MNVRQTNECVNAFLLGLAWNWASAFYTVYYLFVFRDQFLGHDPFFVTL